MPPLLPVTWLRHLRQDELLPSKGWRRPQEAPSKTQLYNFSLPESVLSCILFVRFEDLSYFTYERAPCELRNVGVSHMWMLGLNPGPL